MSRGEIRAHIADCEDGGRNWPRDPDGAPLYPGLERRLGQRERDRRMAEGEPFAWRLDMEAAMARVGRPDGREFSTDEMAAANTRRGPAAGLGRRGPGAPRHPDELPSVGRHGRRAAGRHPCRARPGSSAATSVHRLLQALLGLPAPAYFHHRLITGAGRPQAVEEQPRHRLEGVAAGRHEPRRNQKNGRTCDGCVRRGSGRPCQRHQADQRKAPPRPHAMASFRSRKFMP